MTKSKQIFYYLDPPDSLTFHSLFSYFWNHGIGRPIENGVQSPWNKFDLEHAFLSRKKNIDVRTIENWKSGRSVPLVKNLIVLSNIASTGENYRQKIWSEAFIRTYDENRKSEQSITRIGELKAHSDSYHTKRLGTLALIIFSIILTIGIGYLKITNNKARSTMPTVFIADFKNNSDNPELEFLASGLSTLMTDALFQIDNLRALKTNKPPSNIEIDAELKCVIFGQTNEYYTICQIIEFPEGAVVWSRRFEFSSLNELNEMQKTIPQAVAQITEVAFSEDAQKRMSQMGTSNLESFIAYQKGRLSLKQWHSKRTEMGMADAHKFLLEASILDRNWSEPKFHLVDVYHHYVSGDTETLAPMSRSASAKEIKNLLAKASDKSINNEEKFKAKMNEIFFSENWSGLISPSKSFVDAAIVRRGELEWLYEPVILLLIGNKDLTIKLLDERLIKYDPYNGTGHAYKLRHFLLNDDLDAAKATLENTTVSKFQNRIDEVSGFIDFRTGDRIGLQKLVNSQSNLSQMYQDYFTSLDLFISGQREEALKVLDNSQALMNSKEFLGLAYLHLGEAVRGREILEQVSDTPLGDVDISTAIAYGAACGINSEELPEKLVAKFTQAQLTLPECID